MSGISGPEAFSNFGVKKLTFLICQSDGEEEEEEGVARLAQYHTFHIRVARQMTGQGSENNFDERLIAVKRRQLKKSERERERESEIKKKRPD